MSKEDIMKLSNKQKKLLKIIEYLVPKCNWEAPHTWVTSGSVIGTFSTYDRKKKKWLFEFKQRVKDGEGQMKPCLKICSSGIDGIEAFFLKTERGKLPEKIKSKKEIAKLLSLMWGKQRMELNITMWKEDLAGKYSDGVPLIYPKDFDDAPKIIRELFLKTYKEVNIGKLHRRSK